MEILRAAVKARVRIDVLLLIDLNRDTEIHMIHTCFLQIFGMFDAVRSIWPDINLQGPFCSLQVLGEPPPSKFQWRRLQDFTVASISIMACLVEESLRLALLTRQTSCVWKPGAPCEFPTLETWIFGKMGYY